MIEHSAQPDADVNAAIAHERARSPSLGGRTVFDDRNDRQRVRERANRDQSRPSRPRKGQLDLFSD